MAVQQEEGQPVEAFRDRLKRFGSAIGVWSIVADATLVEIAACAGLDFVILDLEHGAYDLGTLEQAIRAAECAGTAPLVRVPDLTAATFQRVLDLGAHGVIVPQVRSVADAKQAIACAHYGPRGVRGYNPFVRAAQYAAPATMGSGKLAPGWPTVGIIIETLEAYEDLDAICALPDLDLIYLGTYDMSVALGCAGNTGHPNVQAFVEKATATAKTHGKAVGIMVRSPDAIDRAVHAGIDLLVYGVDATLIHDAYRGPVHHLAQSLANKRK